MLTSVLLMASFVALVGALICFLMIVRHAFVLSAGLGVMVLFLPIFNLVYAFRHFEHRYKGPILAGWLGLTFIGMGLRTMALQLAMGH